MKTIIIFLLLITSNIQAQIKPLIINDKVYYKTTDDANITFIKHSNVYYLSIISDSKDTSSKHLILKFKDYTLDTIINVTVDKTKYILTYDLSTIIKLDSKLQNLFLTEKLISYSLGNKNTYTNTFKYKRMLIKLINY